MAKTAKQRSKHHGTLELRGKTFRARWEYNGRVYTRSTRTGNRREAERRLEEFTRPFWTTDDKEVLQHLEAKVAAKDNDLANLESQTPGFTLMQSWAYFYANYKNGKCDPATMRNYEQWFWIFAEWLKACHPEIKELRQVSTHVATDYTKYLLTGTTDELKGKITRFRRPIRGTTYNRHLNALALIWKTVAKEPKAKLGNNPFAWDKRTDTGIPRITLKKADKPHKRRDLNCHELHKLLCATTGEMQGILALGYYTGLRFVDCILMRWDNIDLDNCLINVCSHKTDENTCTRIHPTLWTVLQVVVKTNSGYLFPNSAETYNQGTNGRVKLSNLFTDLFRSIGIETQYKPIDSNLRAVPDCTFHSLRHSFCSHMQRAGFDRSIRQVLMGHATPAMTSHYEHNYADAPLALPDLLTSAENPADNKLAQLTQLMSSMSGDELKQAKSLVLARQEE